MIPYKLIDWQLFLTYLQDINQKKKYNKNRLDDVLNI